MIVDEVDDTRTTLKFCVDELIKTNSPKEVAVAVVHNKRKEKKVELGGDILYLDGEDVADRWNCYPWDAAAYDHSIDMHESIARKCAGEGLDDSKEDDITSEKGNPIRKKKKEIPKVPLYYVIVILALGLIVIFNLYSRNTQLQKVVSRRQQDNLIRSASGKDFSRSGRGRKYPSTRKV